MTMATWMAAIFSSGNGVAHPIHSVQQIWVSGRIITATPPPVSNVVAVPEPTLGALAWIGLLSLSGLSSRQTDWMKTTRNTILEPVR